MITLVSGLLAMLLVFTVLRDREVTYQVAVASHDIRAGTPVTRGMFRYTDIKASDQVRSHLITQHSAAGYDGWVATRTIATGELVNSGDFRPPGAPQNLRSMSIPIVPPHAVGGALQVGDRVDVTHVDTQSGKVVFVAKGVEVIAVTEDTGSALSGGNTIPSITVTVNAEQALAISGAIHDDKYDVIRSTGAEPVASPSTTSPPDTTTAPQAAGATPSTSAPGGRRSPPTTIRGG